ncbi:CDP-alcohol phosphatidyltransferase family protein [candidate division TA06 bacterium]|uniref:CDP-alcohol phosphatidyltransferase family protein n=1 Tax=candidate division TA06 bacterium TaxID=2250710 RepID=A0A933I7N2_UNCT6|nr:CDP-alcohol phosphatidyltransferase family protein [candidate division TA06 bacterium]
MNLPNILSFLRIGLLPFIVLCLKAGQNWWVLGLLLLAVATDYFDGFTARKLGQVTDTGRIIDPLADKICVNTMVIALWLWRDFPWWAVCLIAGRDLLIVLGGMLALRKKKAVPVSNWPGKIAVTFMAATIICYSLNWQPWGLYLLYGSVLMVFVSGAIYLKTLTPFP